MIESREDLKAYLDGQLSPAATEAVRAALETDADLAKELRGLREVGRILTSAKRNYEPTGLDQTLNALNESVAQAQKRPKIRPWVSYSIGLGLAAAFTLVFAGTAYFNSARTGATDLKARLASAPMTAGAALPGAMYGRALQKGLNSNGAASHGLGFAKTKSTVRPPRIQETAVANGVAAGRAAAPAITLSLPAQLQQAKQQLQALANENAQLKAKLNKKTDRMLAEAGGSLPALPISPREISPENSLGDPAGNLTLKSSKGVGPKRVAQLEVAVKSMLGKLGAKLGSSSGVPELRTVTATANSSTADVIAASLRKLLGTAGDVSIEQLPRPALSPVVQARITRLSELRVQRDKLLIQYLPEAPQIRDLDAQIASLEAQTKITPQPSKSRLQITIG